MIMRLIVPMAALLLVILVACGGESKPTPSSTATSAPSPTPSPTATSAPSPTPSPAVVVRERSRLTPEQEACLAEAIGERAAREVSSGQRPPTSHEIDAIAGCRLAVAVGEGNGPTPEPVAVEEGKGLTPEQEACLVEAIGEQAVREAKKTGERPPTPEELDALVGCGIMEPQPSFELLPEASAPAVLGTVSWPNNVEESSALFERLPSEIAGHRIRAPFERRGAGFLIAIYGEDPETTGNATSVTVQDLAEGGFFPPDTNAGQFVALYAQGSDWEVLAAGREGDLAWVQWKGGPIYHMHWGNAPSSMVFTAMANDLRVLMALVEAMVSAASG